MRFTEEEKLTIIAEGQKIGVEAVCAKYDISDQTYRVRRYKAEGTKPRKHFSLKKKLKILEEGIRDGIYRTYAAYHINPTTYYNWRHEVGFTKLSRLGRPAKAPQRPNAQPLVTAGQHEENLCHGLSTLAMCTPLRQASPPS